MMPPHQDYCPRQMCSNMPDVDGAGVALVRSRMSFRA
jgi:hypothetical protein